ncbi:GNAT family N-acetyltransferase [Kribbella jejuensis]|uniref:Ribosomal protein S18 acetylase RimI-like enzyme n=1 Tax=Kribbella jejuensis TaxID=236068 RepID=A0A542DUA4_9ACTN|nr:GNAT family N-acetyltransferase [Kribbella jejuensis]TQJ06692.1 ribosomal protein S18 acetylase RimI-like enzyme [Kribbella jejuensis]
MIRPAEPTDTAAVNELLHELGYPQDDPDATTARLKSWADDPAGAVFVADAGGNLLGLVAVYVEPFIQLPGSSARIVALVVSDRARRQGVATELMGAAESFAVQQGCVRFEVTSSNYRTEAHKFYESRGYVNQAERSSRFLRVAPPQSASGTTV